MSEKNEEVENIVTKIEDRRTRQINFLRTHYNNSIVIAAIEYADREIEERCQSYFRDPIMLDLAKKKAIDNGQQDVANFIEKQIESDEQDAFNALTFAYVHGMVNGINNPNINKIPEPVTDYVLKKDFAFIFDYCDNDFSSLINYAAQEFCNEYNRVLRQIELYSNVEGADGMVLSYMKDIEFMENPDNVRQLMKAAFVGQYMISSIDRCYLFTKDGFDYVKRLEKAQDLADNYFHFESNSIHSDDNTERILWKFGTWEEVSKYGLEYYKKYQGEDELKYADGDFTKYWLNGEVLIVRMIDGKLVAETK